MNSEHPQVLHEYRDISEKVVLKEIVRFNDLPRREELKIRNRSVPRGRGNLGGSKRRDSHNFQSGNN